MLLSHNLQYSYPKFGACYFMKARCDLSSYILYGQANSMAVLLSVHHLPHHYLLHLTPTHRTDLPK